MKIKNIIITVIALACFILLLYMINENKYITMKCKVTQVEDGKIFIIKNNKIYSYKCDNNFKVGEKVNVKFNTNCEYTEDDDVIVDVWR